MNIQELIAKYAGVSELPLNKGFKETWFQKIMRKAGWYVGAPWCAFAAKVFWTELHGENATKRMSGNALQTYLNLESAKNVLPEEGGLVVWRMYKNGKPTKAGHIGVVTRANVSGDPKVFYSLEGNTSGSKLDRDGDGIWQKQHVIKWEAPQGLLARKKTGLVLLGFIDPPKMDCMPEGINSKEDHDEYLKAIGTVKK